MTSTTRIQTPFGSDSTAAEVIEGIDLSAGTQSSPAPRPGSASRPRERSRVPALRSPSPSATPTPASAPLPRSAPRPATRPSRRQTARPRRPRLGRRLRRHAGTGPLHLLVNNAGVMALPSLRADAGAAGSSSSRPTISATSRSRSASTTRWPRRAGNAAGSCRSAPAATLRSPVVFDDINFSSRPYDPWLAYGQSKTANVLFAVGATTTGRPTGSPPTPSTRAGSSRRT